MPASYEVLLFEHTWYGGRCEAFTANDDVLETNSIGNDTVSSIKVGSAVTAVLYEHTLGSQGYGGRSETFGPGTWDPELFDNWIGNDTASSIVVYASQARGGRDEAAPPAPDRPPRSQPTPPEATPEAGNERRPAPD